MKVKRICKNCNSWWDDTEGVGDVLRPGNILRVAFDAFYTGITHGSAIDMQYMETQHQTRKRTCPNCGSLDTYYKKVEKQKIIESPQKTQIKQKNVQNYRPEKIAVQENSNETKIETEGSPFNWTTVFFISLFLGFFGMDRLHVGKTGTGILKLLTFGCYGIWWLVDLLLIASGEFTDAQGRKITKKASAEKSKGE